MRSLLAMLACSALLSIGCGGAESGEGTRCGDGVIAAMEECDDGNADDTGACLSTCVNARCGDGHVRAGVEACDDGNTVDGDGCSSECGIPSSDTTAPRVTAFSIAPVTLTVGSSLTASYSVTDETALARVELRRAPHDSSTCSDTAKTGCAWTQVRSAKISGTSRSGTLDDSPPEGTFFYGLRVADASNNAGDRGATAKVTATSGGSVARKNVIFYDDAEDEPSTHKWKTVIDNGTNGSIASSADQARAGSRSYRFRQGPPIPDAASHNLHVELRQQAVVSPGTAHPQFFAYGREFWIGYSVYIPVDYDFPSGIINGNRAWDILGQFHSADTDDCDGVRNPMASIHAKDANKGFFLHIIGESIQCGPRMVDGKKTYDRQVSYDSGPLKRGAWNDVVLNFRFSYTTGGFFKAWLNGEQFADDTGMNCFNDTVPPYFRMGMYGLLNQTTTVYYDEIRIGNEKATYADVAP